MSVLPWLDENARRAYPLVEAAGGPPPATVLDFGCSVGTETKFVVGNSSVWLAAVSYDTAGGHALVFRFESSAPGMTAAGLEFRYESPDLGATWPDRPVLFGEVVGDPNNPYGSSSVAPQSSDVSFPADDPADCPQVLLWEGFLVPGPGADTAARIGPGGTEAYTRDTAAVEPARIQSAVGTYVRTVNAANGDRTVVDAPPGCAAPVRHTPAGPPFVAALCVTGVVRVEAGYNAVLAQSADGLTVGAAVGAGAGRPCGEVPVFAGEEPPAGSAVLTGGPECGDAVVAWNGAAGPHVEIAAGPGVTVTPGPGDHEITITVGLAGMAVCPPA